ncbi:RIP metalloprotease RseP [Gangjinia marincola]|uniref:Zinc metalloprotease n=1 Tax=Gangjinia marincola TaxID=578463 RepID=A0ABN1MJ15_9FLAO
MDTFLIKGAQLLLSLSILIVLHELGHFIPAKLFKTRVEKFYLFFDVKFSLFKKKIGETVYGIGWLPLGGYVKIAGMIDESMDKEQMAKPPQPWEFRSKPAWQRLIIMLGGVTVNFILAVIIYICLSWAFGDQYLPMDELEGGVYVTQPDMGEKLGIQTGDKILKIDGEKVENFNSIHMDIINGNTMTIERDGEIIEQDIPVDFIETLIEDKDRGFFLNPRLPYVVQQISPGSHNTGVDLQPKDRVIAVDGEPVAYRDEVTELLQQKKNQSATLTVEREGDLVEIPVKINEEGMVGIAIVNGFSDFEKLGYLQLDTTTYNFFEAIPAGWDRGVTTLQDYIKQFKKIINPDTGAYKGVGGFGAIGNMFPAEFSWVDFWERTAFISIILAFMNILPIPALDGGHVVFLLYEMVTGRKPGDKFMEYAQVAGFVLLLTLVLFANGNDIYRAIFK